MMERLCNKARGALLGLACGDAVGTTLEFCPRDRFGPVTDMIGGGKFRLAPGEWTDDTSMALCLADSLLECEGFDARDQMERYWRWANEGYNSVRPHPIGMGKTVVQALRNYRKTNDPYSGSTEDKSAGNGSLMRLAPVAIYYSSDLDDAIYFAKLSAATTHQAPDCLSATGWFAELLVRAMTDECDKHTLLSPPFKAELSPNIQVIANGSYHTKTRDQIKGSGWVVESLEAALWAFWHGTSFEEAVLLAVNLGDDADTTAAITGQLAGACYGLGSIPEAWLSKLYIGDHIDHLAKELLNASTRRETGSEVH